MSSIIPLEVVDDEEFEALNAAIAAAESSASSNKKFKTSTSQICPSPLSPCNLRVNAARSDPIRSTNLSTSQARNKLEFPTECFTVENGVPCSTSLHGSGEGTSSRSLENIAADGAELIQSESLCVHPINRECGSFCGISKASTEETCIDSTNSSEIIQVDRARFYQEHAGQSCSDVCKGSNGQVLHPGLTEELGSGSSWNAPRHEDTFRNCNSSRRLSCPSSGIWQKSSMPSGYEDIQQTTKPRVDNELALSLDLPDVSCADNFRVPWGIVPHNHKVTPKRKLPSFQFKGQIIYSGTVLDAKSAANELLRQVEAKKSTNSGLVPLGFDTEWKTVFKRGAERRKVAVVQVCIDADKCNIFHVIHTGIPSSLKSILEDPMVSKVGIGSYGDAGKLRSDYNVKVKGLKDLSGLANLKMVGCANKKWGLSSLAEELLGKQVDKAPSIRMGDWEAEILSEAQLQYAATDAFASLYLFQVLASFPDPRQDELPKTQGLEHGNMN